MKNMMNKNMFNNNTTMGVALRIMIALLGVSATLGIIFCLMLGSVQYIFPFMKVAFVVSSIICLGLAILNKA